MFGFFNFIESFIDIILHFVPMYYTFKTLAIVWLMLPQTQVRLCSLPVSAGPTKLLTIVLFCCCRSESCAGR